MRAAPYRREHGNCSCRGLQARGAALQIRHHGRRPAAKLPLKADPPRGARDPKASPANRFGGCALRRHSAGWTRNGWQGGERAAAPRCADLDLRSPCWFRGLRPQWSGNGTARLAIGLRSTLIPYAQRNWGSPTSSCLPIMEHPFGGSWGYQTVFAIRANRPAFGAPEGLRPVLVDACPSARNLGVNPRLGAPDISRTTPQRACAWARFDGTALYEHEDPRRGPFTKIGNTCIYNFGPQRGAGFPDREARLFWLSQFHVRRDCASMRVRIHASTATIRGEARRMDSQPLWRARKNLEAIEFLRRLKRDCRGALFPARS